jgi:hypothetical protein
MSNNPLDIATSASGNFKSSFGETLNEVREFCEGRNSMDGAWARSVWYYAAKKQNDPSRYEAHRIDGLEAEEVRKAARGVLPNYAGWSHFNMQKHIGLVKYRLSMGMTQASFDNLLDRWREKWRESAKNGQRVEKQHTEQGA